MRKLVSMTLNELKGATKHLSLFTSTLSQLQDCRTIRFEDNLKAIFLLMNLLDSWPSTLSNSSNLAFDGVVGSIFNEEIRRKN